MSIVSVGRLDAFCTTCKTEVIVSEQTLACPHCGRQVDPLSLPSVPKAVEPAAPTPVQSVNLPSIKQSGAWSRATDDLLAALEVEEAAAIAAFDAVRERARVAKRAANAMRQLRAMVRVEGDTPTRKPPTQSTSGRWSRKYDACVNCGTMEVKHLAHGRCQKCHWYWEKQGQERPR